MLLKVIVTFAILTSVCAQNSTHLPVVMWHGMGDSCCSGYIKNVQELIEEEYPGIYVLSLEIGAGESEDLVRSYFGNMNKLVDDVCDKIATDPQIQGTYNAIGFSQGSQFIRAVAQRCGSPSVNNLITIGGQHQGVYGYPNCPAEDRYLCDLVRKLLSIGAYVPAIQNISVQAQYWHDPLDETEYREQSIFLADINQENAVNEDYKQAIRNLNAFVMVKFNQDEDVQPIESQWFGFYHEGQSETTYTLQESSLYIEDRLGLKELDEAGKIHFLDLDGEHMEFTDEWFIENIIIPYL